MMSLIFRIWRAHRVTFRFVAPSQVLPAGGGLTYRSMVDDSRSSSERLRNCFNDACGGQVPITELSLRKFG